MTLIKKLFGAICLTASLLGGNTANAGIPVIDAAAVTQAVLQVQSWAQQFQQMQAQFTQMQQQYTSLNGIRNMASLVNNPALRAYLPQNYQQILNSGYGNSSAIRTASKVWDITQTPLSPTSDTGKAYEANGVQAALNRATAEAGYQAASNRFADIQVLLDQVNAAPDAKDIADLQARIQAEQVMMANEQNKLAMLGQLAAAQKDLEHQAAMERQIKSRSIPAPAWSY